MERPPPPYPAPPMLRQPEPMPPMRYEPPKQSLGSKLKKIFGPLAVGVVVIVKWFAKLKFIFIPLLKFIPLVLKTGGTMILSMGAYALVYPWQFAVGFVLLIFIHECGHLIAARKVGLPVSAPMFIPFVGAIIALKEAPRIVWIEAQVGIGGPLLGSVGAGLCYATFILTGEPLFRHLAYAGFLINLFNLAPIGFLDGGRIVTALSPWLWVVGTIVIGVLMVLHFNPILLFVFVLSLPRLFSLFRKRTEEEKRYFEVTPGQRLSMGLLYFGLAAALAFGMKLIQDIEMPTTGG